MYCVYGVVVLEESHSLSAVLVHPNDDDNHETEIVTQDNNDNRPECPYGTACYRKNPQHKLEYKHSAPPVPERRTRQKLQKMEKGLWRRMRRMKRRDAA
ncbi:aprataxin and PNK-like factor [Falco naumanni]|uniref:aprataxin and PNK-like factor n=1 Tax=Falco naumanni TaxID=148594 RepID=UPI001ADE6CFE|nr:aprataxin and PNK-like factor [Falco naumanni]